MATRFLYQANENLGEMLFVNSPDSFVIDRFQEFASRLNKLKSLSLAPNARFYPEGHLEDGSETSDRALFRLSSWLLAAVVLDENDQIRDALLVRRSHPERALIIDGRYLTVLVSCHNGFQVDEGDGIESGTDFLATIVQNEAKFSFEPNTKPNVPNLDEPEPEEEEENEDFVLERPAFESNRKTAIRDLGSSNSFYEEEENEEDNEEETPQIEVERPAFTSNSKKGVRQLGSVFAKKRKPKKEPAPEPKPEEEPQEESEEDDAEPVVVETPAFEPAKQGKVKNLGTRPKKKAPKPEPPKEEEPEPEPFVVEKPAVEPVKKDKPKTIKAPKPEEPITPSTPDTPVLPDGEKRIRKRIRAITDPEEGK